MRPVAQSTAHNARLAGPGREVSRALPPLSRLLDQLLLRSDCGRRGVGLPIGRLLLFLLVRWHHRGGRIQFVQNHAAARHREAEYKTEKEQVAHALHIAPNAVQLELRARCRGVRRPLRRRGARQAVYAPRCLLSSWPRHRKQPRKRSGIARLTSWLWSPRERRTRTLPPPPSLGSAPDDSDSGSRTTRTRAAGPTTTKGSVPGVPGSACNVRFLSCRNPRTYRRGIA